VLSPTIEKSLKFKREFVLEDGRVWPQIRQASEAFCAELNERMRLLIAPDRPEIDLETYNQIARHANWRRREPIPDCDADLDALLSEAQIESSEVVFSLSMDWGFEEVVVISRADLIAYFDDLWFADDFFIVDPLLQNALFIDHHAYACHLCLPQPDPTNPTPTPAP
jgi:hypothetical protein